ncbi:MAG: SDR family NAD(P)-dependent oxidoreductase [Betaproteobacteria bacterium]|nr:SDR family NAD(P)-dependent oxidoreductase [Betaproteobacteria bacterium]
MTPAKYVPPTDLLLGRVILVTGATGGIGRAVSMACAIHGATVVLHGRDQAKLDQLYDALRSGSGTEPAALPLDLAGAGSRHFDALAADIDHAFGRLDGVVHCASHTLTLKAVDAVSPEEWKTVFEINVASALGITRACLPLLRDAPDASVIYTLESHHAVGGAYQSPVSLTGAGLAMAVRTQSEEWSSTPTLRCNGIVPGPVNSPSRRKTHPGESKAALPSADTVVPLYLWLLGRDGSQSKGLIHAAQD